MSRTTIQNRLAYAFFLNLSICALVVLSLPATAFTTDLSVDPARIKAITAMLPQRPVGLGRPITDRAVWEAMARRESFKTILKDAEKMLTEPLPQSSDELYLEFSRTGNRSHWETLNFTRRGRIASLVLAECLENKGRFLPAIGEVIKSVCAERTWILPAHDRDLANFKGERNDIDLVSSSLGWTLATTDWLFGNRLDADLRKLIRVQVGQRVLEPFKDMVGGKRPANWWITGTNNWNSVCLAGVCGAALALVESPEERSFFVACAEKFSRNFLSGFTSDGYCSEGVGYWNYGFGHYLMLAETILRATGNRVDLLAGENVRQAALYGTKIQMVPGVCPAFADCSVDAQPSSRYMWYVNRRWMLGQHEYEQENLVQPAIWLFDTVLFAFANSASHTWPAPASRVEAGERTWFDQAGILISRPGSHSACRLAVALKGGHNAEHHNHNDVGSYVVVVGHQPVLVDPGSEVYTARTFSSHRYDSKVLNSYGHPVPMVAGKLQKPGVDARGHVVRSEFTDEADSLVLDIRSAYDVPDLAKLERTFVYERSSSGALIVTDEAVFKSPQAFGTAIITFGKWRKLGPDRLRIEDGGEAVEVAIQATGGDVDLRTDEIHEDLRAIRTPTRVGIDFAKPVDKCKICVRITPISK